jgi:hypothetical protein
MTGAFVPSESYLYAESVMSGFHEAAAMNITADP